MREQDTIVVGGVDDAFLLVTLLQPYCNRVSESAMSMETSSHSLAIIGACTTALRAYPEPYHNDECAHDLFLARSAEELDITGEVLA